MDDFVYEVSLVSTLVWNIGRLDKINYLSWRKCYTWKYCTYELSKINIKCVKIIIAFRNIFQIQL